MRHGAKSEPATTDDLRLIIETRVEAVRKSWSENIRKVVSAPSGAEVIVNMRAHIAASEDPVTNIRLSVDPTAHAAIAVSLDVTHPYRQKEVLKAVTERMPTAAHLKGHHTLAIRKVHKIDDDPVYYYKPNFASPQYSAAFIEVALRSA